MYSHKTRLGKRRANLVVDDGRFHTYTLILTLISRVEQEREEVYHGLGGKGHYSVNRSAEAIAKDLFDDSVGNTDDEDETNSISSETSQQSEKDPGLNSLMAERGTPVLIETLSEASGVQVNNGGGSASVSVTAPGHRGGDGASVDTQLSMIPRYWKKGFIPLSEEQMEALRHDRGQEALEKYLDLRFVQGW